MKQIVRLFASVLIAGFALMYLTSYLNKEQGYSGGNTLTVYNWGDYIDEDLIAKFEDETGVKVIYQTFDSNEAMLTKIAQGGTTFDVAVPSDYTISKMREENLLLPLDKSKIPNLKDIDPKFMNLSFDPNNEYSVPYFWGTVGIVYNPELVTGKTFESWADLWSPDLRNQILLVIGYYLINRRGGKLTEAGARP